MKRYLIPINAFLLGAFLIAGIYFGVLTWAQGWDSAYSLFLFNRWYVLPIFLSFGIQAALYSILRFRLLISAAFMGHEGTTIPFKSVMGTNGVTSTAAMVACCLHHATDVLPILGLSALAAFLTRYQRPFMLVGLGMNMVGIIAMLAILYREHQKLQSVLVYESALESK